MFPKKSSSQWITIVQITTKTTFIDVDAQEEPETKVLEFLDFLIFQKNYLRNSLMINEVTVPVASYSAEAVA